MCATVTVAHMGGLAIVANMNRYKLFSEGLSLSECKCEYRFYEEQCKTEMHVWFIKNMDAWSQILKVEYNYYEKDIEIYSTELLKNWNELTDLPYSWRIKVLGLKRNE